MGGVNGRDFYVWYRDRAMTDPSTLSYLEFDELGDFTDAAVWTGERQEWEHAGWIADRIHDTPGIVAVEPDEAERIAEALGIPMPGPSTRTEAAA